MLRDLLRLLKWLHMVTTIFITDLSPFDASPLTKLFMILVSRPRRSATIAWATILEPCHLATSLQAVWNQDIRGWTALFALGPLLLKEIGEIIIEIWTWISNHIA